MLGQDGLPLPQVTVTVKGRPQYGQTQTRADGYFDLAVEGGGGLTVDFRRDGYFPAQRLISVDWNQYGNLEDVVMVAPDSTAPVSTINLACNTSGGNNCPAIGLPVHAAPKVTSDAQPARGAIVIFPHTVTVTEAPDNQSVMQPTTVNVSTTEYTKDISVEGTSLNGANPTSNGRLAMPGNLPPASAYTYAVDLFDNDRMSENSQGSVTFTADPLQHNLSRDSRYADNLRLRCCCCFKGRYGDLLL